MASEYDCRLIIVSPVAGNKANLIASWLNSNLAADTVSADLGPALSATGSLPATHRWVGIALTRADAKKVLSRLCALGNAPTPTVAQWDNADKNQKKNWWLSRRQAVFNSYGVWCQFCDNDGDWDDIQQVLQTTGLKPVDVHGD